METHNAPHTTRQTPQDHTSSHLLRKIVADTLYGDISQDSSNSSLNNEVTMTDTQNNHNTAMCPSHPMDTAQLGMEGSQNHSVLEHRPAASYWKNFMKK